MLSLVNLLGIIPIVISLFGASVFLKNRLKVAYAFCMPIICASIITLLFLCSLVMNFTFWIWLFFGLGLLCLVYEIIRKEIDKTDILNWTNLFLLLGTILIVVYLAGRRFIFIDDFTHWAVMARHLVEMKALPTSADPLITFTSYVPGTALWISFFVTLVGGITEDTYLIAQAFLILIFFLPFTAVSISGGRKPETEQSGDALTQSIDSGSQPSQEKSTTILSICMLVLAAVVCAVTMTFSASILSLCVDGALAASALCSVCFVVMSDVKLSRKLWLSIPLLAVTMLIKTAGILFAASAFLILIYLCIREKKSRLLPGLIAAPVICTVIELFWQWHVKAAFPDTSASMHSLSFARWHEIYESRGAAMIDAILKEFFRKVTLWYLVLFVVALIIIYVFIYICGRKAGHHIARQSLWLLLLSLVNYVVYLSGMLFVYLFSMEDVNADRIAAFDRYMWVELLFLIGTCMCIVFRLFCRYDDGFASSTSEKSISKKFRNFAVRQGKTIRLIPLIIADVVALAFLFFFWNIAQVYDVTYEGSAIEVINESAPEEEYTGDILIYAPSSMDAAYEESLLLYFGKYKFRTTDVRVATFERGDVEERMDLHSHLFVVEVDEQINEYLHSRGWTDEIEPGLYDIEAGTRIDR